MKSLRTRYKELRLREIEIKKELHKANRVPKLEVLHWLDAVDDIKKQVKQLENSCAYKILSRFSLDGSGYSYLAFKLSKEIKRLWKSSQFPNGVCPQLRILVEQSPSRSQLFGTIWENLMDPDVMITSIYGDWGVGKTTAMMSVRDKLATSELFDSIFWVTAASKLSSTLAQMVYQLQTDLAQQMKLDLPESGRASMLLEGLNRSHSFLIIIDGLCEDLTLMAVGIPEPNRENRSKIVLISQDRNICYTTMNLDKIIKVDVLSSTEKWNLFASKAGDMVLAQEIKPLAKRLVELCPGRPALINAIGHAMRDEVSIQVWRRMLGMLAHLVGFNIVSNLLKICYERLKDDVVQKCFLHCALFPSEYMFKPEELIRYWIDENLIHEGADIEEKVNTGIIIMRKLVNAKMMEMSEKNDDTCIKMAVMWRRWATNAMEKEPELCHNILLYYSHIKNYDEVDQLREISTVAEDMFTFKSVIDHPKRPQLLDTIWENLMNPNVRIMSICGEWGVGKTTAMMKIKKQLAGISDSFDSIIWVTLSKVSGLYQLQTDIALQINLDLPEIGRGAKLLNGLEKIEKFLIIIDDVSKLIPLIKVGIPLPSGDNRYKIVLISRDIEVCSLMKSDKIIKVDAFSLTEKWDLFVSKAANVVINPYIKVLARRLVELCPGRPLIINAISYAMRDEISIQVWRNTVEHLMGLETEGMVFELLRICYECLKDDMVQKCFLYCALFPEDYHFTPEELIRYWMAESFLSGDADIITERDNGFKIMGKLLDASLLEMSAKGEDEWLKIPYLCRVLAIRILKEEPGFDVYAGLGLEKMPYNTGMGVVGKVSLVRNQIEALEILPISFNNASTLLLHENPISDIHPSFFTAMLALQFLDLSYTWITELPSSVSDLSQLRVLFLHHCSNLENLPSLQKLTKLQVLSLSGTSITELPHGMEGLVSLRSLDLSDTAKLLEVRSGMISTLSHLEELRLQGSGLCKVDSPMVTNYLMEIRCLKRLKILTISTACYGDILETVMCLQEHNLKIFSIKAYGSTEDCDEDV
ncbi:hypothetical protein ACHQM5_005839 [Ranunculus cassubicifolius]